MQLRDYQTRTTNDVREAERAGPVRICVQSPTGSGKSVMLADLLTDKTPQLVLTHRRVLLDQLAAVLAAHGIRFGFRAAGCKSDTAALIQLGMFQTEHARVYKTQRWQRHTCTRLHVDEIHAQGGETAAAIFQDYHAAGASIVGWTATPSEIGHLCDRLIVAATVPELIGQGWLVPPIVFGPDMPDCERLERMRRDANGEFNARQLEKVWNPKTIFGRVVEHYFRLNPQQKPAILFAPGVPHSLWFAQRLTARGVRAAHIDADRIWIDGVEQKSDAETRQAVFNAVESGSIKVLCNRFVLREGVDLPCIEHVIAACAFGTRTAWVQAAGRGLRPAPGKERCIVQDHGGNWLRHPKLDTADPWDFSTQARTLACAHIERIRSGEESEPIYCPNCSAIRIAGDECPVCGHRFTRYSRPVLQVTGELQLQEGKTYLPRERREHSDAEVWRGLVIGNKKYHPQRTPEQIHNYHAMKNDWRYLPRDLPGMPRTADGWKMPIGKLTGDDVLPSDKLASEQTNPMPESKSSDAAEVTYSQLKSGGWGLRGTRLEPGRSVEVTLKNGGTKREVIGKIVWEGQDDLCLATIAPTPKQATQLRKCGYSADEIAAMDKGSASELLDELAANDWQRTDSDSAGSQDDEEIPF